MTSNERDIELLKRDPNRLIIEFQGTIGIIVKKFITSGMFRRPEMEDVVQCVNEALLSSIPAIQRQYNGSSLLKTYLSSIVRNACLKLQKKTRQSPQNVEFDDLSYGVTPLIVERPIIEHAVKRFKIILTLYHKKLPKLLLCLKLHFRIPLVVQDITTWYPECTRKDIKLLMQSFGSKYDDLRDFEVYRTVTPIINRKENKSSSDDAVRKWIEQKIGEIIVILNGKPPDSAFDEEALRVLVEDYFSPFLTRK